MKVKVPLHGRALGYATLDSEATKGATVGVNLFWADGSLVQESDFSVPATDSSDVSQTLWTLVAEIPVNVQAVADLATDGFVRKAGDVWTASAPEAAEIAYDPTTSGLTATNVQAAIDEAVVSGGSVITEDTWANRPPLPSDGDVHYCTDAPSMARFDGTIWRHRIGTVPVTPPVLANFSQVNFGTTTTAAFGPFTSIIPQVGLAYNLRVLDMAAPATPYTIEFGFLLPQFLYNGAAVGPLFGGGFRESSSGKMHLSWYDADNATNFRGIKMDSATAVNSIVFSLGMNPGPTNLVKMRVRDDGTNRYVDAQQGDGSWQQVSSIARTNFITADRVCIAVNIQAATAMDRIHWVHWKQY